MTVIRHSILQRPDRCRFALGLAISSDCRQVRGAIVGSVGHALEMRLEVAASRTRRLSRRVVRSYRKLRAGKCSRPAAAALLAAELAEQSAVLIDELAAAAPQWQSRAAVVGVLEPGLWARSRGGLLGYVSLCDAARLADLTGLNVIDAFPARDLAQEGRGGPLHGLPDWLLFRHPSQTRLCIDLGPVTRISYLPAARDPRGMHQVTVLTVDPGMKLVDAFARRMTEGRQRIDAGGHLAVQGQRLPEVLELWHSLAESTQHDSIWRPRGRGLRPWIDAAVSKVGSAGAVRDLLCSATHFVAESIARAVQDRLPPEPGIDELLVTGGGQYNGLLISELQAAFPRSAVLCDADLGLAADAHDPAVAAVLALMHLDQTPACPTAITGARTPRVLGRLTPGSPQLWQRLLRDVSLQAPSVVSLRSAL